MTSPRQGCVALLHMYPLSVNSKMSNRASVLFFLPLILGKHFNYIDIRIVKDGKVILMNMSDGINHEKTVADIVIEDANVTKLKTGTFEDLLLLKSIKIHRCGLTEIEEDVFRNLPKLRVLSISGNKLKTIKRGNFNHLMITNLYLSLNAIESLEEEAFHNIPYLEVLDLSQNNIQELHPRMFKGTPYLRIVNLSFNKLSCTIPNDCFLYGLDNIVAGQDSLLDLSDNELRYIGLNALRGIYNIKELDLKNNNLEQLDPNIFDEINYIEELHLQNNYLRSLNNNIFRQLRNCSVIDLQDNPWNCSFVKKFLNWNKRHNKTNTLLQEECT